MPRRGSVTRRSPWHVKGQAVPAYDPRGLKGMGLGYATSNRGACHLRAYVAAAELGVVPDRGGPPRRGRARASSSRSFQDLHAFSDSLDLCKFSAFAQDADLYAKHSMRRPQWASP